MTERSILNILGFSVFSGGKEFFSGEFKGVVNTISHHSYIIAQKDSLFCEALMASDYIIPDGVGIVMTPAMLDGKKIEKIAGSDLHEVVINAFH